MELSTPLTYENFFLYDFSKDIDRVTKSFESGKCEAEDIALLVVSTRKVIIDKDNIYVFYNKWKVILHLLRIIISQTKSF